MHLPSEMLVGPICPVTVAVASLGVLSVATVVSRTRAAAPSVLRFAMVSAVVFGLQMLNYPIASGISGHLIAGVFAASILGVPAGVLSLTLVLTVQSLLFADGGLAMLGANVFNMAILGAGAGGGIRQLLIRRHLNHELATGLAAFCSVELAVLALCLELMTSGKGSLSALSWLVGVHTALAVVEGVATVVLVKLCAFQSERSSSRAGFAVLSGLLMACLLAAPFASVFPDAFEWTMGQFNLLPNAPSFVHAPLADYTLAGLPNQLASSFLASVIGVGVVMLSAWIMGKSLVGRVKA